MGNSSSAPEPEAGAPNTQAPEVPKPSNGLVLYRGCRSSSGTFQWEEQASGVRARLYDANEDTKRKPEWHLEVEGAGAFDIDAVIDDDFMFDLASRRAVFAVDNVIWALHSETAAEFEGLHRVYERALFENKWGLEYTPDNEAKVMGGADGMHILGKETAESIRSWADDMDVDQPAPQELQTPPRDRLVGRREAIQGVVMGAGDRSYLIREGEINVMRNAIGGLEDAAVRLAFTPPSKTPASTRRSTRRASLLGAPGGGLDDAEAITPSRALLMARESQMAMLTPARRSNLLQADLETGRVVSEWSFQKDGVEIPMEDIVGDTKSAQLESRQTFLGLGTNRLVRWDLRDPSGAVQDSPVVQYAGGKDYARNTNFTCMATSGDGYVVVGSRDGRVRLYSESMLSQAKTSVPSLGAPVTAVDVTYDGRWVVATTDHYLMVVKTAYKVNQNEDDNGRELCGFTSRMGANAPAPRLLRLRPEDAVRTQGAPFQKGHFTWVTERGRQERWVVASCGAFTIRWNLRSVKIANAQTVSAGGLTTVSQYQLIPKQEHVVDSTFMHENFARGAGDASLVVVTDNYVYNVDDDGDN